jgi:sugar phosphate permease
MAESKPVDSSAAFRRRLQIYTVAGLQVIGLKTVRASLSSMVPFIVAAGGMTASENAMLLSAFFPGYAISQLLLGGVVQVYGSKAVLGGGLGVTSLLFVAAPALSRLPARALALSIMLFGMGVAQGPMAPANSQLNRAWMPPGQERVWALKAFGLAHQSTNLIAALFTPILCRQSWHVCCYVYGCACAVLTVVWQLLAENKPPTAALPSDPTPSPRPRGNPASGSPKPAPAKKAIEWQIFRVPAVLITVINFVAYGAINYSMMLFAPSFFVDKLGCTPEIAGRYIALVSSVNIPGQVAMGLLESALVRWKVPTLTVRRWSSGLGALLCSACTVLYSCAQTPSQGFFAYLCYQISHLLHEAGQFPNM